MLNRVSFSKQLGKFGERSLIYLVQWHSISLSFRPDGRRRGCSRGRGFLLDAKKDLPILRFLRVRFS